MRNKILVVFSLLMFAFMFGQEVNQNTVVPDFDLKNMTGESVLLSNYTSSKDITFIVFFTTWCPWCSKQMETFEKMSNEISSNVGFLAIAFENDSKKVANKIDNLGVTYPVIMGNDKIAKYFNISGIPVTVILDKNGTKIDQIVGFRDKVFFMNYLKD